MWGCFNTATLMWIKRTGGNNRSTLQEDVGALRGGGNSIKEACLSSLQLHAHTNTPVLGTSCLCPDLIMRGVFFFYAGLTRDL